MANSILEKQNEQRFIDMLSAQRHFIMSQRIGIQFRFGFV